MLTHIKLSEEEKKELIEKYNISLKQLPMILDSDPALQGLDAKPEDVIKIVRKSRTKKKSEFFRVIIHG